MAKASTARKDTIDRALTFGSEDQRQFPPVAGPVQPGPPPSAGPAGVPSPAPLQPAHAEQSATAGSQAIVRVDMPPTSASAHAKVPAEMSATVASAHAKVPVETTAEPPVPVPLNLKEVTAVIWDAMEDKKEKAKLLAAETRKAKAEAEKAGKASGENPDGMDASVATPLIKGKKKIVMSAIKSAKTPEAVAVKKTNLKIAKKPAGASEQVPTRFITVSHEKSRSRFCVRLFTDGTAVASSFSYKGKAKGEVEKQLKAHLLAEQARYGVEIPS